MDWFGKAILVAFVVMLFVLWLAFFCLYPMVYTANLCERLGYKSFGLVALGITLAISIVGLLISPWFMFWTGWLVPFAIYVLAPPKLNG